MEVILVAFLVVVVLILFFDLITAYILCRFKELRKEHPNKYILQSSIVNVICFTFILLHILLELNLERYYEWNHIILIVVISSFCAQLPITVIMITDWYILTFPSTKLKKYFVLIKIVIYVYIFSVSICLIILSFQEFQFLGVRILFIVTALSSFAVYLILSICYLCQRTILLKSDAFVLNASLFKILPWVVISVELLCYGNYFHLGVSILILVLFSHPLQLIAFYVWDQAYRSALFKVFCCTKENVVDIEGMENLVVSVQGNVIGYKANTDEVNV